MSGFKRATFAALIAFGLATASQVYAEPVASPPTTIVPVQNANKGPTVPPDLPPSVSDAGSQSLSVKGCDVTARSRDNVVGVLLAAPASPGNRKPGEDAPEYRPGAPVSTIDKIPAGELEKVEHTLRTWQVCKWLGQTYQQMALETDQLVRESVYHSTEISTPFSEPTINELLDRREEVDALHYVRMSGPGVIASLPPIAIDLTGTTSVSPEGDYVVLDVVSVDEFNGEQHLNERGSMAFRLVDGIWLVDRDGQLP
ncbi:MAG: hypothetical protein ACR2OU_06385 [Thermomicrobiales bacterium]